MRNYKHLSKRCIKLDDFFIKRPAQPRASVADASLKQNLEKRLLLREYYYDFFQQAPMAILMLTYKNVIIAANLQAEQLLSMKKSSMLRQQLTQFILPEDMNCYKKFYKQLWTAQQPEACELRLMKKDKASCWLQITGSIINLAREEQCMLILNNISKRKQKEKALVENEKRFEALFKKAPLAYQSLDFNGCFLDVNQEWLGLLGYKREEVLGKWFGDFLSSAYQEGFRQRFPLFKAQGHIHSEFEMLAKNGNKLFISFDGKIGYDAKGEFQQTHCILKDITLESHLEKELAASEEKYRNIFHVASDALFLIDMSSGAILDANAAACRLYGYSYAEILQLKNRDLFIDLEETQALQEGQATIPRLRLRKRDGTSFPVEITAKQFLLNNQQVLSIAIRDVTEEEEAAVKLRNSEASFKHQNEIFASLLKIIPLGVFMVEAPTGKPILANATAQQILGRGILPDASAENLSQVYKTYKIGSEEHYPTEEMPITLGMQGKTSHIDDMLVERPDGTKIVIEVFGSPVYDEQGQIKASLVSFLDITERKQAEENLRKSEEKYKLLYTSMDQGVALHEIITDADGKPIDYLFLDINASYTRLTGITKDAIGKRIREVMPEVEQYWIDVFGKVALTGEPAYYENYLEKNDRYYATYSYSPQKNQFAVLVSDVTDRIKKSEEILYLSYHDQLTGLYNRRFYEEELKRLDQERNLPLTIAMGDVNGLKLVNDSFGHALGDELLQKVAEILRLGCRADDIIARIGGDEFVIILPKADLGEAEQIICRINELAAKEKVGNLDVSISFGYGVKREKMQDLQEVFKDAENQMYRNKLLVSHSLRSKTIDLIMHTLYENNHREMQHSLRVSELCGALAVAFKLEQEEIRQIKIAGLMHDIGKIGIPEQILNSTNSLTAVEKDEIKRHSEIGYRILSSVSEFSEIASYVLEHQERWDGTGYPRGLQGAEICLPARIIAIADAFDAMTRKRAYGKSLDRLASIAEMQRCSGTQFDPELVEVFLEKVLKREEGG